MGKRDMKGFKADALARLGPCPVCGRKLLEAPSTGHPGVSVYVVSVQRAMWDPGALQRRVGLEMQIGVLAGAMGPDEDLAKVFDEFSAATHEECAHKIASILDLQRKNEDNGEEA